MVRKSVLVFLIVAFFISFLYAFGRLVGEKLIWHFADKATNGAIKIEEHLLMKVVSGIGNHQSINEHIQHRLSDKTYTFEQFKEDERGKISYEIKFTKIAQKLVASYKDSGLIDK